METDSSGRLRNFCFILSFLIGSFLTIALPFHPVSGILYVFSSGRDTTNKVLEGDLYIKASAVINPRLSVHSYDICALSGTCVACARL